VCHDVDIVGNDHVHRIPKASPDIFHLEVRIVIPNDVIKGETFPYQFYGMTGSQIFLALIDAVIVHPPLSELFLDL